MEPIAVERAKSLYAYAQAQGAVLNTFVVTVKPEEAMELLEWYATQYEGANEVFDLDVSIARRTKDPWPVLANFELWGMQIGPTSELH